MTEKAKPEQLTPVERLMYDEIVETRADVKRIDRKLARVEVKSGIWGTVGAVATVLITKIKFGLGGS